MLDGLGCSSGRGSHLWSPQEVVPCQGLCILSLSSFVYGVLSLQRNQEGLGAVTWPPVWPETRSLLGSGALSSFSTLEACCAAAPADIC